MLPPVPCHCLLATVRMEARRGSGVSVPAQQEPGPMVPSMPDYHSMSAMSAMSQHGPVAAMSGYYSPGPVLVNPPHLPTYSYGIPPSPLPFPGYPAPLLHSHASLPMPGAKQPPGLRRAGSINAKIFNAEAR